LPSSVNEAAARGKERKSTLVEKGLS